MGSGYIKPQKKYISKALVMRNLELQEREFDRLVALCRVHPYVPKNNRKVDQGDGFYYRVADANRLVHSDVYKTLVQNKRLSERSNRYAGTGFEYKIQNIRYEEYGYVDLVRSRFKGLEEAVDELGHVLSSMYLGRLLGLDGRLDEVLGAFEDFVTRKSLLECSYMSQSGVYNQASLGKVKVVWFVPYPGASLKDVVEEKRDVPPRFEWSSPNFLDFASSSEEEDEGSSDGMEAAINDPEKTDISLLSHSIPLFMIHCRLVLHKVEKLYEAHRGRPGIFSGMRFYVSSGAVGSSLRLAVLSCGGSIAEDVLEADVHVCERVEEMVGDVVYVQPQYVFDCLNTKKRLPTDPYHVGRVLPRHVSPFAALDTIVPKESLMTLSKTRRHRIEDLMNQFEDVDYEH